MNLRFYKYILLIFLQIKEEKEILGELKNQLGDDPGTQKFVLKTPKVKMLMIKLLIVKLMLLFSPGGVTEKSFSFCLSHLLAMYVFVAPHLKRKTSQNIKHCPDFPSRCKNTVLSKAFIECKIWSWLLFFAFFLSLCSLFLFLFFISAIFFKNWPYFCKCQRFWKYLIGVPILAELFQHWQNLFKYKKCNILHTLTGS